MDHSECVSLYVCVCVCVCVCVSLYCIHSPQCVHLNKQEGSKVDERATSLFQNVYFAYQDDDETK